MRIKVTGITVTADIYLDLRTTWGLQWDLKLGYKLRTSIEDNTTLMRVRHCRRKIVCMNRFYSLMEMDLKWKKM